MKFSALVAIIAEDLEEKALAIAKDAGAGGVTITKGRGISAKEKKTFFGLTYEGAQSILIFVLERKLSLTILKRLSKELELGEESKGVAFTLPLEHLAGIGTYQLKQFEEKVKEEL